MIAEALRGQHDAEWFSPEMIRDWKQAWQWRPHSQQQLTHGQLRKCRPGFKGSKEQHQQQNTIYKM